MIAPIIISGGSGTRLWPLSRKLQPKQFISLGNDTTLFQDTILRLPKEAKDPIIICNEDHRFLAAEQLREINKLSTGIILEPIGKNTAPAIALAALKLYSSSEDPILLVLPADHMIEDTQSFHEAIKIAETLAIQNKLVTFGILPNKAETGYGYIEAEMNLNSKFYNIKSFKEKPSQTNANKYFKSGKYLWNSGMFMFKSSIYLQELEKFAPEILACCKNSLKDERQDHDFIRLINEEFLKCPELSIDYAVMEHTKSSVVVPLDANWNDVGSWESLMSSKLKDTEGNVVEGDVILDNVENTFAYSSNRLVSAVGVSGLIIVDTSDALLVTSKEYSQNIKNIVAKLKDQNRPEAVNHRKVFRPWGYYDSLDVGDGFQAKRICVKPGEKISLQKHKHRSEHWVVVSGTAKITCGDKIYNLEKNQSTYIPKGEVHRLENEGAVDLEIIEVQTGDYLGEDDIIRLEDDYERD
ncbi:mannose-1-phosphate guanylyltransferase/mannose-6-phosphate isomerase [Candidatus Pseudothioglobus sp. Uisw_050_01]|uniref:mannose-1-phosphate guanylyltransferase/mannose-6-phosphate isomerase n=1 Tax=Candidatus Pseudothioglobus sp. Uisw_050_01 TaxID=3230997 RepID=UPI003A8532FE